MSDEARRLLENEARYDEKVMALLTCLREGHTGHGPPLVGKNVPRMVNNKAVLAYVEAVGCERCHLVHWRYT